MVKITIKAPRPEEVRSESESEEGEESSEEEVEVDRSQGSGRSKRSWSVLLIRWPPECFGPYLVGFGYTGWFF